MRGDSYEAGFTALVNRLRKEIGKNLPNLLMVKNIDACPDGYVPILLSTEEGEAIDLEHAAGIINRNQIYGDLSRQN